MARVRIHRLEATVHGRRVGYEIVRRVTRQIEFRARVTVSYGPYTTGRLALSLRSEIVEQPGSIRGRVGSPLNYAASVNNGARRHVILPHRPPHALAFFWRRVNRYVILPAVRHPGQRGKHYLTHALAEIARINGMRYIVHEREQ